MDMTAVNLVLSNNGTTVVGDNSQVNICKRCLPRQQGSQSKSAESGVFADGKGASSQRGKRKTLKRRKRKRSSKVQTTSNEDGNSADGENSDSDNADKLQDFLQSDSDD